MGPANTLNSKRVSSLWVGKDVHFGGTQRLHVLRVCMDTAGAPGMFSPALSSRN